MPEFLMRIPLAQENCPKTLATTDGMCHPEGAKGWCRQGRPTMTGITLLIFALGTLIGVLMGGALCVHYLRHEIAADICPRLRRLQLLQLLPIKSKRSGALLRYLGAGLACL